MMRARRLALMLVAMGVVLALSTVALAAEGVTPTATRVELTAEPDGEAVNLSARLATVEGRPVGDQVIQFAVVADFFGKRTLRFRTAYTDTAGIAVTRYEPSWNGTHEFRADFAGTAGYEASQGVTTLEVAALPPSAPAGTGTEPLVLFKTLAGQGVLLLTALLWLVLLLVLFRVGWVVSDSHPEPLAHEAQEETYGLAHSD